MRIHCLATLLLLTANLSVFAADNWPRYRGPDALGVAEEAQLPDSWDTSKNVDNKLTCPLLLLRI